MKCPYCGRKARRVMGRDLYPNRKTAWKQRYLACVPCRAWVRCHDINGHKWQAMGTMATAELRRLRQHAHVVFDPIWKSGRMTRESAYQWLARELGIHRNDAHFASMDDELVRKAIELCRKLS